MTAKRVSERVTIPEMVEKRDDLNFTDDDGEMFDAAVTAAERLAKALRMVLLMASMPAAIERDACAVLDDLYPGWLDDLYPNWRSQ